MADRDREPSEWLRPGVVRTRLLEELALLPPDQHLAVLEAVERRDVEIVLSDPATITIIVAQRWHFAIPVRDVVQADRAADAGG